jgi:ABC-type Zn uptake system ZnuABC Zn-binding protein ZnuA
MRRLCTILLAGLVALGLTAEGGWAAGKIRIVASLPDLKALSEAVGGDLVEVDVLARGDQNPHDLEVRPSLMVKLRRTDLLIRNGVEDDPWVEPLLQGINPRYVVPGHCTGWLATHQL